MPPGKRRQSNAMLYTLITFVGLFIAATTVAVVYYVKAEELRTRTQDAEAKLSEMATAEEVRTVGSVVGARLPGESNLGTMIAHLDRVVALVKGGPLQVTTAEVKVGNAMQAVQPLLTRAQDYVSLPATRPPLADPNVAEPNAPALSQVALTSVMSDLLAELQRTIDGRNTVQKQLGDTQNRFTDATLEWQKTEQSLQNDKEQYRQQVEQIKSEYDAAKALLQQSSDERAQNLLDQLDQERTSSRQLRDDLLKAQAELNVAQERLEDATAKVNEIAPPPDREAVAFAPDGKVILVDEAAGVVSINLGADDRVYRGLTFSVYDKAAGIPRDGKPKAEVEILAVDKKVATARILASEKKNPIATDDIVANLIWDRRKANQFVVAGEFDLDGDDMPDYDAIRKIAALIQKWGATVSPEVSAKTDFLILGTEPQVPPEPTLDDLAVDPTAMERYNAASQELEQYEQIRQRAQAFWVPIFSYERFLHFTGYASHVGKPGAF